MTDKSVNFSEMQDDLEFDDGQMIMLGVKEFGISPSEMRFILAMERGELDGDTVDLDAKKGKKHYGSPLKKKNPDKKHLAGQHDQGLHRPGGRRVPSGKPVSESLKVTGYRDVREKVERAISLIDSVHGDGKLPKVDVIASEIGEDHGHLKFTDDSLTEIEYIVVNEKVIGGLSAGEMHSEMTAAHEIGHLLDLKGMGENWETRGSQKWDANWEAYHEAITDSPEVRELEDMFARPHLYKGKVEIDGNILEAHPDSSCVRYYLQNHEGFARAYAQYIATKTGDPAMNSQLDSMRGELFYGKRQWSAENFKPIEKALDNLFAAQGWIK